MAWKKRIIIAVVLLAVMVGGAVARQWAVKDVRLVVDGREEVVKTSSSRVEDLLVDAGIQLSSEDLVFPSPTEYLTERITVQVNHAFPVDIAVDGEVREIRTAPATVSDILRQAGVQLAPGDSVEPGREERISQSARIAVARVETKETTTSKSIPFQTVRRNNYNLDRGLQKVVQQGKDGQEEETWQVTLRNGEEFSRQKISSTILSEPVSRIVEIGANQMASRGGTAFRFKKMVWSVATAYSPTGNKTYTGTTPKRGTVAVDPLVVPLGSRLYVEGYGFGLAEDVGTAIKGSRVDVFFESDQEAIKWGRKRVPVYILED